jgi:hypothetical protein
MEGVVGWKRWLETLAGNRRSDGGPDAGLSLNVRARRIVLRET